MLTYSYTARNAATGEKVRSEVQADNEQTAAKMVRQLGLAPLEIKAQGVRQGGFGHFIGRVKLKDKILFSRQLSTLLNAGLPLLQSLRSVGNQTVNKRFKVIINQVISEVEGGSAFSAALAKHPEVFNRVYISLVAAGEASGTLDKSLERLAVQQEKDADLISKVRGALVYPVIVIVVMIAVVSFMLVVVLPQVQELYKGLRGVQLPIFTRMLLAASHFTIKFWWVMLGIVGLLIFLGSRWVRSLGGRSAVDSLKLHAGPVGQLYSKMYMARFARTGSTLVAGGVPLIQVLEITADAVDNIHVENSLKRAIEKVKGGKPLSDALQDDPNFLELVPNMLRIGEQSGSTEGMMEKVADYYEKEVDNQIKTISTIIEPVLIIVIGVVAMAIVAAILLPIYGLVGKNIVN